MTRIAGLVCAIVAFTVPAGAEVIERSPSGFVSRTVLTIDAPRDRIFAALVNDIGDWWNGAHTFSGDGGNMWLNANPGGCLCETMAPTGGVEHGVVIHVVANELLRLRGAFGPLQEFGVAGTLTWEFAPGPEGSSSTRATITYSAGGFFPGGLDKVADAVDTVMAESLTRLKAHVETRRPQPAPPAPPSPQ